MPSGYFDDIESMTFDGEANRLRWIVNRYEHYRLSWEKSNHEPSRMIALFLKSMRCYFRCDTAINKHDTWHLEIESANLMPVWKMHWKTTFLKLQCEYMKCCYNNELLPPVYREIMRASNFCVKSLGRAVAFDEQNENQNLRIKKTPPTNLLELSIKQSRHVMVGDKAAKEMWGMRKPRKNADMIQGTTLESDVMELEKLLATCNLFVTHNNTKMDREYFWKNVNPDEGPVGSP
jgi:hypothetical protein